MKTTNKNKDLTPQEAYTWLTQITPGCRNPDLEKVIATDAYWAYEYAYCVLKGRFELGEPIIAKDPELAFNYAVDKIKYRWKIAEPIILKSNYTNKYKNHFNIQ